MFWLFSPRGRRILDLEAKLRSHTKSLRGDVELEVWSKGHYRLEIEVKDYDYALAEHPVLDLAIGETLIGSFPTRASGRTKFIRTQDDGPLGFDPHVKQNVAIGHSGIAILTGSFRRD